MIIELVVSFEQWVSNLLLRVVGEPIECLRPIRLRNLLHTIPMDCLKIMCNKLTLK